MEIHQVNAKQGLQWILSGFYLFRKAAMAWIFSVFYLDFDCHVHVIHSISWKIHFYAGLTSIFGWHHDRLQRHGERQTTGGRSLAGCF